MEENKLQSTTFLERYYSSQILQIKTIMKLNNIFSVLEVGPGRNITRPVLTYYYDYKCIDVQIDNKPDILGNIEDLNIKKYENKFDIVCSFQMLEHRPYNDFISIIKKFILMSNKYIFISLPYHIEWFNIEVSIPTWSNWKKISKIAYFLKYDFKLGFKIPYLNKKNREYSLKYIKKNPYGVHYWEINRGKYTLSKIIKDLELLDLKIIKKFHNKKFPYHYFILMEKTTKK